MSSAFLRLRPVCGERDGFRDRVIQRGGAARLNPPQFGRRPAPCCASTATPVPAGCRSGTGTPRPRRRAGRRGSAAAPACAACIFSPDMLPLVSRTMPRLTGHALGGEVRDRTELAVLVDAEVLLAQAGDEAAAPVADRGRDVDQLDAGSEAKGFLIRSLALLGTLLRGDRGDGREGERERRRVSVRPWRAPGNLAVLRRGAVGAAIDVSDHRTVRRTEADAIARDRPVDRHSDDERRLVARGEQT